ncbi:hypothetical protein TNIN_112641 [Trichonephila inaurata madagascariensis]|uniref:Uncharacterized protein n=1 Tax=Trichonephila inaurata madagascariensis TaxID=2747483 RepID=A0A8X7CAE8_9ARAC|nr:hypothetical protein TNIN_112641 [Trichonephila inaurata madagascariensis]
MTGMQFFREESLYRRRNKSQDTYNMAINMLVQIQFRTLSMMQQIELVKLDLVTYKGLLVVSSTSAG